MTIEECYTNMGADYGDVLRRLGNEDRVKRFLGKIPEDTSFSLLCEAYEKGDGREAFRAAHSLKGIVFGDAHFLHGLTKSPVDHFN